MKMSDVRFFVMACLVAVAGFVPARAQEMAPPEAQLAPPGAATAAQEAPAASQEDETPAPASAGSAVDPCPDPETAVRSSPDDLAKVQEDIDRFTLCVQRAQLLERFNESVSKNVDSVDQALGYGGASAVPGLPGAQQNGGLAPLPPSALAGADVSPVAAGAEEGDAQAAPAAPAGWTISQIYGSGADVHAILLSPEGDEVRVATGSKLPDDGGVVSSISTTGVSVRVEGKSKALEWSNQ